MKTVWLLTQPSACREHVWKAGWCLCPDSNVCAHLRSGVTFPGRSGFIISQRSVREKKRGHLARHLPSLFPL